MSTGRWARWGAAGLVLAAVGTGMAQETTAPQDAKAQEETRQRARRMVDPSVDTERTFFLNYTRTQADQNEILTALRNLLTPVAKIYLVPGQNAIAMVAPPDQMALAEKVLRELDVPRKVFRLTYTVTESDAGKRVGVQHFSVVMASGLRTLMKQGNRVPLVTGTMPVTGASSASSSTQVTYIDVGVTVDATADALENGVGLRTKVEISSVAGDLSSTLSQDPVLRQTLVEGTSVLSLGKPLELESLDVPGSTRHVEVEVVAELVK